MPRPTALLSLVLLPLLGSAAGAPASGPADSRLILVLDQRNPGWTVKAKLRLVPTFGPFAVWAITGTIRCVGDGCPGRHGRLEGSTRAAGDGLGIRATFRRGTVCTFTGTTSDPGATDVYSCLDAAGNVTLQDTFHVGGCRCGDRVPGSPGAFCATGPCPF
jgi:hypothetical protein